MAVNTAQRALTTVTILPTGVTQLGQDIRNLALASDLITPPADRWVTPDDFLELFVMSSLAGVQLQVVGRLLLWDGTTTMFGGHITTVADRLFYAFTFPLQYGFLLGATVYSFGTPVPFRGQVLAQLSLTRTPTSGLLIHYGMGQDYITRAGVINWPFSRIITGVEGPGIPVSVLGTTPAAGAEFTQTVPTNARWRLHTIRALFTASATVANRTTVIRITDGVNLIASIAQGVTFTANQQAAQSWVGGYSLRDSAAGEYVNPLAFPVDLLPGWIVGSATLGLQAGDQWSQLRFDVEEWLEG